MKVVLVTGSRELGPQAARMVGNYLAIEDPDLVIHGDARGADSIAREWARSNDVEERGFPAKWKELGKRAGPIRNQEMLEKIQILRSQGHEVVVLAFPLPSSKGTHHMIAIARGSDPPFEVEIVC